jgi:hypothetical protein
MKRHETAAAALLAAGTFAAGVASADQVKQGIDSVVSGPAQSEHVVTLNPQEDRYAHLLKGTNARVVGGLPGPKPASASNADLAADARYAAKAAETNPAKVSRGIVFKVGESVMRLVRLNKQGKLPKEIKVDTEKYKDGMKGYFVTVKDTQDPTNIGGLANLTAFTHAPGSGKKGVSNVSASSVAPVVDGNRSFTAGGAISEANGYWSVNAGSSTVKNAGKPDTKVIGNQNKDVDQYDRGATPTDEGRVALDAQRAVNDSLTVVKHAVEKPSTAGAKPHEAQAHTPEPTEVVLSDKQIDQRYNQAVGDLKQGNVKGAQLIYSELLGSSADGTVKDYDGDGDKEAPYDALKKQIDDKK